ncbi:MAG: DUF3616 domain-containing protein [Acidobacteriota bacterium]
MTIRRLLAGPTRVALLVAAAALWAVASSFVPQPYPRPLPFQNGTYEASGVVDVPGANGVLFVDDGHPKHVFWMGVTDSGTEATPVTPVNLGAQVPDMEDIARDGRFFYVVGSQSQGGGRNTDGLVRFQFDPATKAVSDVQNATGLRQMLSASLPELLGGGRRSAGLNIEGLAWDASKSRLLLGLRSPMAGTDAVIVPITLRDARAPLTTENLEVGAVVRLPLTGRAIRGLGYDPERRLVLILAGASTYGPGLPFALYEWDGASPAGLREIATFPQHEKPEGVTRIRLGGRVRTLIVFDTSGFLVR